MPPAFCSAFDMVTKHKGFSIFEISGWVDGEASGWVIADCHNRAVSCFCHNSDPASYVMDCKEKVFTTKRDLAERTWWIDDDSEDFEESPELTGRQVINRLIKTGELTTETPVWWEAP